MSDSRQPLLHSSNRSPSPNPAYNPSAPPPDYSHSQQHNIHHNNYQASSQQHNNSQTQHHGSTRQYVPVPVAQQYNPGTTTPYHTCINDEPHNIRTDLTLSGVLCGILLFPIGLACMLTWLSRRCTKCGTRFS